MDNKKELIRNLSAISVLSKKLAKTDKKYARLSEVSEQMAKLTKNGMETDEVIKELLQ